MLVIDDTVQANDLASHLKTGDLVAPVFGVHAGLEKSGSDGIQRGELFSGVKQRCTALDRTPDGYEFINPFQFFDT